MTKADGVTGRLIKGSVWITVSRLLVNMLSAGSTIVLAANLDAADFGIVAIATTVIAVVAALTDFSLSQALVRHEEVLPEHLDTAFTLSAIRGGILFALFAIMALPLAKFYEDLRLAPVMLALGAGTFINSLANPRRVILTRALIFWQEFALNVSAKIAAVVVSITTALIYHTFWALVLGTLAGQFVNVVVSYMAVPYRPHFSLQRMKELLSFSIWLSASQIVNTLNWRADNLLVGKLLGKADLGHYDVGNNLAMMPTREAISPLSQTLFPAFSTLTGDRGRLTAGYQRAQSFISAMALPIGFGATMIADPLVRLMMGDRWAPAALVVQVLSAVFAMQTLGQFAQALGMALGQTKVLFRRDVQLLVGRLPLVITGMVFYGIPGLLAARVISGLGAMIMNLFLVRRFIGLSVADQLRENIRPLVASTIMIGMLFTMSKLIVWGGTKLDLGIEVACSILVGAVAYIVSLTVLWIIAGRPNGPEAEVRRLFLLLCGGLSTRRRRLINPDGE